MLHRIRFDARVGLAIAALCMVGFSGTACSREAESIDGVVDMPAAVQGGDENQGGEKLAELTFERESLSSDRSKDDLSEHLATPDGRASFDGLEVNYRFSGVFDQGRPAIVLVHGWGANVWAWHKQVESLPELGLPVLAIDLPGHGTSATPQDPAAMTLDLFADAILAVLKDAGVQKGIVVGHSNGAAAALRFYRRYPGRTAALGTVDGALLPMFDQETAAAVVEPLMGPDYEDFVTQVVASMQAPGLAADERQGLIDMAFSISQQVLVQTILAPADPAMYSDDPIEVPLLAIKVKQPSWSPEYEAKVRSMAKQLDYQLWEDVGHYVQLEKPDALAEAIQSFLVDYSLYPN